MGIFLWLCYYLRHFALVQFNSKLAIEAIRIRRYLNCIVCINIDNYGRGWVDHMVIVPEKNNKL